MSTGPCDSKICHRLPSMFLWLRPADKICLGRFASRSHATRLLLPSSLELFHWTRQNLSRPSFAPYQADTSLAHLPVFYNRTTYPHDYNLDAVSVSAMPAIQHILGSQHLFDAESGVLATRSHRWEHRCGERCAYLDRPRILADTDNLYPETTAAAWRKDLPWCSDGPWTVRFILRHPAYCQGQHDTTGW